MCAQSGSEGTVTVTVVDPTGRVVPAAPLKLVNVKTNVVWAGKTTKAGTYSFVGLPIGSYQLTTSKTGFESQTNKSVTVQAGQVTAIRVGMKIGQTTQTVTVSAAATPLLQTTSNSVATTINMKQLEDLPLSGRSVVSMAYLVPGYAHGTWNGMPLIDQATSIDGVISSSSRMKFSGNLGPGGEGAMQARLDSIAQMTVTTADLSANQGYGQSSMEQTYVTQSGTNAFHGKVYEDFRNSYLNANTWTNDAINSIVGRTVLPTPKLILNDFGGDIGGPIIKNKLFFFGAFGMSKQPTSALATATVLTPAAQMGNIIETTGAHVCLLQVSSFCPTQTTSVADQFGLRNTLNPSISSEITKINSAVSAGTLSPISGESNYETLSWLNNAPITQYFPTVRVDYDISPKLKMDIAYNETKFEQPNAAAPYFPGNSFANQAASNKYVDYTTSLGIDWTISPTLINQFRGGYFYNSFWNTYGGTTAYLQSNTVPGDAIVGWPLGLTSGQNYHLPVTEYYPIINFSDSLTWEVGSHTFNFGGQFWREQDHYWNPPDGILNYALGLPSQSAQLNDLNSYFANAASQDRTDAEGIYAALTGVVSFVGPSGSGFPYDIKTGTYTTPNVGEYPLDELQKSWGLFFTDSWRVRPSLTLNYGLRWDFLGPNHDLTGAYHTANTANVFGPTAPSNLFQTGVLGGVANPLLPQQVNAYQSYDITPQPQFGIAWNPRISSGLLGKLTGHGNTVIRAAFDVRRFTEPQQYVWNAATNLGFAYYQHFSDAPVPPSSFNNTVGTYPAGELYLGLTPAQLQSEYPFSLSPTSYQKVYQQSSLTYVGNGALEGINYNIKQPYMEEWTLGIQRQFGQDSVLSVRYLGHHAVHEWLVENPNVVNIFQNNGYPSFFANFRAAQQNLAINTAAGLNDCTSGSACDGFAYEGLPGETPTPVFEAAFANEETSPYTAPDYSSGTFIDYLHHGSAGAFASALATTPFYFCSMVGTAAFTPCSGQVRNVAGQGYPINYFQANPYMNGNGFVYSGYTDSAGFGNYNGLQVDFRQNNWHGMEFDENYTWSHSLGIEPNTNWEGYAQNLYTIRDSRLSYGPSEFDIRQVAHVSGTYDLPFGRGQRFADTSNPILSRMVSGWTVGTIITYQTGTPYLIGGGYNTFNNFAPGGVSFNGITISQLQNAMGVYPIAGATTANGLPSSLFQNQTGTNGVTYVQDTATGATITQNTSPGTFASFPYVYGPHHFNTDIAVTKYTKIRENVGLTFQGEFLNAFNHPNWSLYNTGIGASPFVGAYVSNGPRSIQLRASIDF